VVKFRHAGRGEHQLLLLTSTTPTVVHATYTLLKDLLAEMGTSTCLLTFISNRFFSCMVYNTHGGVPCLDMLAEVDSRVSEINFPFLVLHDPQGKNSNCWMRSLLPYE